MMESNSDRISTLPVGVTDIILSKLSIEEAARTSILSKKWRFKWVSLPILTISDYVFKSQFINVVNQILIQHSGSIHVFTLNVSKRKSWVNIEHWIRYLSMKGLTEFSLQNLWPHGCKLNSGLSHFQSLVTLKLRQCHIEIPLEFLGLNGLIRLELEDVTFGDAGLAILTEKCPLLKCLSLIETHYVDADLNIMAPKLEFFVFQGCYLDSISFKTKSLIYASIRSHEWPRQSIRGDHVFSLEGSSYNFWIMWEALRTNPWILFNIRHLHLDVFNIQDSIERSSAVNLITNSPNLDKLSICVKSSKRVGKLSDVEKTSFSASKLKTVEIEEFSGLSCEMEFVELLLSKSPVLESIVIKARESVSNYNSHKMLKELTRFRRAAPYAELTFLDSEDK